MDEGRVWSAGRFISYWMTSRPDEHKWVGYNHLSNKPLAEFGDSPLLLCNCKPQRSCFNGKSKWFKSYFRLNGPLYSAFIQSVLQCWLTFGQASRSGTPGHSARRSQGSNQQLTISSLTMWRQFHAKQLIKKMSIYYKIQHLYTWLIVFRGSNHQSRDVIKRL